MIEVEVNKANILEELKLIDRLDFSVWDIVVVTEWEYEGIWLKLIEIKEDSTCVLRVSPDNDITIECPFDKVRSTKSFVESFEKIVKQSADWLLWWEKIQ